MEGNSVQTGGGAISLLCGDCRVVLPSLPRRSVQTVVTSPAYYNLREYGVAGQLGMEKTPEEYVQNLVEVFSLVREVLKDDGTVWLNLGDCFNNTDKWGGGRGGNTGKHVVAKDGTVPSWAVRRRKAPIPGLKPKDLIGIPWRVALALQVDGWWLRSDIIWQKPNGFPENVKDRPTRSHEYVFLLSKSKRYYYDVLALREPPSASSLKRIAQKTFASQTGGPKDYANGVNPSRSARKTLENFAKNPGRNARDVWSINTKAYKGAHSAVMPEELASRCIRSGSRPGDTVLDPFGGAGTTALAATHLGRDSVSIELNPEYVALARVRLGLEEEQVA